MDARKAAGPGAGDAAVLGTLLAAGIAICLGGAALRLDRVGDAGLPPDPALLLHRVDLDRAGIEELRLLPGVGARLASRIASARRAGGPFASLEDLERRVPGVGPASVARWRDRVLAPPPAPPAGPPASEVSR